MENSKSPRNPNAKGHTQMKSKNDQIKVKTNKDALLKKEQKKQTKKI
jgi:hypothetical protein